MIAETLARQLKCGSIPVRAMPTAILKKAWIEAISPLAVGCTMQGRWRVKLLTWLQLGVASLCIARYFFDSQTFPTQFSGSCLLQQLGRSSRDVDGQLRGGRRAIALRRPVPEAAISDSRREIPWVAMPSPKQVWAHSCVTRAKLQAALADPTVTAIEVDVTMGHLITDAPAVSGMVPIMAHPPSRSSDLSFEAFLGMVIDDGRRHIKFDFKDLKALQSCLPLLAAAKERLSANRQAVWLNADVLPGPGLRTRDCAVPANDFFKAVCKYSPGIHLSLGWRVNPIGYETYSETDCKAMAAVCKEYVLASSASSGAGIVFAVSARLAGRDTRALEGLLKEIPDSQLLFWTGAWEPPLHSSQLANLQDLLQRRGLSARCGYDCRAIDFSAYSTELSKLVMGFIKRFGMLLSASCRPLLQSAIALR